MLDLLTDSGQVRASIKLGLYPMDTRMINLGRERGCLEQFYDAESNIIDFGAAGDVLIDALLPHGDIAPGLVALIAAATVDHRGLNLIDAAQLPQAPSTRMYVAEAVPAGQDA